MARPPPHDGWRFSDGTPWPMGENEEEWRYPGVQGPRYLSQEHFELAVEAEVAWASWVAVQPEEYTPGERETIKEWQLWEHARDALMTFETGRVRCEHCEAIVQKRGLKKHQKTMPCICARNSKEMREKGYVLIPFGASPEEFRDVVGPIPYYYRSRMYNNAVVRSSYFVPQLHAEGWLFEHREEE